MSMSMLKNLVGMYQLAQDEEYMSWLFEFTKKHKSFSNDSFSSRIGNENLFNVKCISEFFKLIDFYASKMEDNIGYKDKDVNTFWYVVKYNSKFFKFSLNISQGSFIWCEVLKTNSERFISFYDIMNFYNSYEFKKSLEKDRILESIFKEMRTLKELNVDMADLIKLLTMMFVDNKNSV